MAFLYEGYAIVANRKYMALRCTGHRGIHDFITRFNQLYPVVRPAMMAQAGGDEQLRQEFLDKLFLDMQQHLIKAGTFASLAALQDVASNYGRSLEAADRVKSIKLDNNDPMEVDNNNAPSGQHPSQGDKAARRAAKLAKRAVKRANGDAGAGTSTGVGGAPKKRKFAGTVGVGKPPSPCFHCGGDHWSKDCKSKRADGAEPNGSKKAKFVPKSKANPNGTLTKKQLWDQGRCFKCGGEGHTAKACKVIAYSLGDYDM